MRLKTEKLSKNNRFLLSADDIFLSLSKHDLNSRAPTKGEFSLATEPGSRTPFDLY